MRRLFPLLLVLFSCLDAFANDLTGTIVDAGGKPIRGAHVSIYMAFPRTGVSAICPSCYRDCGKSVTADARGKFRVASLDNALLFRVLAVADGYEPAFANDVDAAKGPLTIQLKPRAAADRELLVRGRVVDPKGKPVAGATVEFHALRLGNRTGYGKIPGADPLSITDARGEFALKVPERDAKLDVRIRARNLAPKIATALLPAVEPPTIAMTVGATVMGRIARNGKPLPGIRVGLVQTNRFSRNWLGPEEIGTDEQGRFLLLAVAPHDEYLLHGFMGSGNFETKVIAVRGEGTTIDVGTLEARSGHRVAGRLVAAGRLPSSVRVVLSRPGGEDVQIAEVAADGSFAFTDVPAEPVHIAVRGAKLASGKRNLEIKPERDVADLMIEVR